MFRYALLLLAGTFIASISQIILKKAALKTYDSKVQEYLNFPVISAYIIFVLTTLLSVLAYKGIPLSMGPILEATSYIYITFFGVKIFEEEINKRKVVGLILILLGMAVYSLL